LLSKTKHTYSIVIIAWVLGVALITYQAFGPRDNKNDVLMHVDIDKVSVYDNEGNVYWVESHLTGHKIYKINIDKIQGPLYYAQSLKKYSEDLEKHDNKVHNK
jgi:hypothetical protein